MPSDRDLLIEQTVANEAKSPLVAYLLLLFLWGLGVHRMYLGRWISGLVMLLLWGLGWLLTVVLVGWVFVALVTIWCVTDLFLIPGMIAADREDIRRRMR
ncbi:MAG: NINE protein [Paracoccus sp. (in: a-proteobacteria)]|nr:NINE protein [Paracoccus sp. (in: a-proteobacteria)]